MPDVQFTLTAQENVSQAVSRIGQSLAGLDSSNAKAFGGMVQSLSRAQTAATQAATALQRLETAEQQTVAAQARAEAAQSRAAQAALRLQQAEQQAAQGMEQMGRAAQQHSGGVSSFFSNALSAATGFLGAQVFSRIGSDIAGLGQNIVQTAGDMERTRAGFTSILGSAQAADALIKQLQTEAAKSPFQLEDFRKASQLLLGMGVAAQDVVPRLHEVSNVVAAVGGNSQSFDRISLALGQIQAKGKVQAQEINQLAESGVAGWDILARAMNKSRAEVIALGQEGKISAETFFQAFAQFANSDAISQAADKQSHTFQGLLSTIGDIGQALMTAFGTPVLQAVEPVLERIVASLSDPQVVTTLGQWGAAAGQFAVGLINAGQTAFTVAQQIIQALAPVTDFLGQLFGIQGQAAPTITPPDFTPAAQSAAQFGGAIKSGADSAKSAKDQVADLERQTRELSRATAEANLGYDHRKQSLQDQLTLLDRQYQAENKAADISDLQAKIAKDRALAVDQYSSQGQAAAARLVDEEARLKQLQREQGHDAAKNAIEDRIKAVDREKQANEEKNAAASRGLQEQIDALRANAAAATALTNAIKPPPAQGADRSRNRNLDDALGGPQTQAKGQSTLGLLQQITDALNGDKGLRAAVDSVGTAWGQLSDAFKAADPQLLQLKTSIDEIAHALGLDAGFAAQAAIGQAAFKTFAETSAALVPQNLAVIGAGLTELNDQLNVTAKGLTLLTDKLRGADDRQIARDLQDFAAALQRQDSDRQRGVAGYLQKTAQGNQRIGDIFQQNLQDAVNGVLAAGKQAVISSSGGAGADFGNGVVSSTDRGGGVGADFAGVTSTTSRRDQAVQRVHITADWNDQGFRGFIDRRTGQVLQDALR